MNKRTNKLLAVALAITLALASLGLAACGGNDSAQSQDNCYGEDLPVVNE